MYDQEWSKTVAAEFVSGIQSGHELFVLDLAEVKDVREALVAAAKMLVWSVSPLHRPLGDAFAVSAPLGHLRTVRETSASCCSTCAQESWRRSTGWPCWRVTWHGLLKFSVQLLDSLEISKKRDTVNACG
jgi:hypothetical protein